MFEGRLPFCAAVVVIADASAALAVGEDENQLQTILPQMNENDRMLSQLGYVTMVPGRGRGNTGG